MQTYYILEDNLERLEKKLARIQNKCNKYDYTFVYNKREPVFRETTQEDGLKIISKFIPVEVYGEVKHNDWRFVATLDRHESGNIIRQFDTTLEIPHRYRTTDCICEHCNTRRNRKETHIVYNDVTKEFKQVGKTCLTEYTRGLSAELVTSYIAMFDTLIEGESPYSGVRVTKYYPIKDILAYAHQCVEHFGYWKTDSDRPTKERCLDYFLLREWNWSWDKHTREKIEAELDATPRFNPQNEDTLEFVDAALWYVRNDTTDNSSYMHNMKVICNQDAAKYSDLGILVSLIPTYYKHIETEAQRLEREKAHENEKHSSHVGDVGERITVEVASIEHVYTSDSIYGISRLFKITDNAGNVYTWWTSSDIDTDKEYIELVGTVKSHDIYNGVKQTCLTRCKLKIKEDK